MELATTTTTSDATVRAPRLTDRLLSTDLPRLIDGVDSEIEYLRSRLEDTDAGKLNDKLRAAFKERVESLERGRNWLAGKIAAETHHRTEI